MSLPAAQRTDARAAAPDLVRDGRKLSWASIHLALAISGFILVAVAQLFTLTEMCAFAARVGGGRATMIALLSGSFVVFTVVSFLRQALLMSFAYIESTRALPNTRAVRAWPSVSILIPAHDEASRIERALDAIVTLDYPNVEAIVVDDGSSDDTSDRAQRYAGTRGGKRIHVLGKPNGGKWSALNLAFHHATGELVVCVDADSHLAPDCLRLLARHFDDPVVGGCAGQVAVRNGDTLLSRFQSLEYVLMNGLGRRMQSYFGSVLVAPGPVSMFRRSALEEMWQRWGGSAAQPANSDGAQVLGPWESDTFAEDADLSLSLILSGKRVMYEAHAMSFTTVPSSTPALLNQRYRWTRGNLQAAIKAWHRWQREIGAPKMFPFWLGTLLFETVIWPLVNIYGIVVFGVVVGLFGVGFPLALWFIALTLLDANAAGFTIRVEGAHPRLMWLTALNRLYFTLLLDVGKFFSLHDEFRRTRMKWS